MPSPTPRAILLDSSANASLSLEGAPVLLSEVFGVAVEEAAGMIDVVEVEGDVGEGMGVGDGAGVGEVEEIEKVEKIVESPIVSIVGGAFCHRT
jgi:hypothetical protein